MEQGERRFKIRQNPPKEYKCPEHCKHEEVINCGRCGKLC